MIQSIVATPAPSTGGRSPAAPALVTPIYGAKQILASRKAHAEQAGQGLHPPDVEFFQWQGVDGHKFTTRRKTYRTEER